MQKAQGNLSPLVLSIIYLMILIALAIAFWQIYLNSAKGLR
jgi:hypothetical protein